jgi:arylsulfatase
MRSRTLLLLILAAAGCGAPAPEHIVLVSIDSLRADHLGAYGYPRDTSPHIDALARQGVLFERALSSTSWTLPAHAALFTGVSDGVHGVQRADQALGSGLPTLAERLREAGYATGAVVSGPFLDPKFGLHRGFDEYLNCMSFLDDDFRPRSGPRFNLHLASHRDVTGPCVVRQARTWLLRNRARRGFLFLHFFDVHYDYAPPPGYAERFDPDYAGGLDATRFAHNPAIHPDMGRRDLEHLIALYDGEIRATDAHLGEVLTALDELGLAETTLVVVTADHGDAFFEHGVKGHQKDLHRETLAIPLVLRGPGVPAGVRRLGPAHITDVAPTILDLAGADEPPLGDGLTLRPAFADPATLRDRWVLSELNTRARDRVALESLYRKVIRDRRAETTLAYDLARDPGEREPLPANGDLIERLDAHVARVNERTREVPPAGKARELSPEMRERLRALGYAE